MSRRRGSKAVEELYATLRPRAEAVARAEFPDARLIEVTFYGEKPIIAVWEKESTVAKMFTWTPTPEDLEAAASEIEPPEPGEGEEIFVTANVDAGDRQADPEPEGEPVP